MKYLLLILGLILPMACAIRLPSASKIRIDDEVRAVQIKELKFGMFICWSFSTFYGQEWTPTLDKDASFFKAKAVDTDQWCQVARDAGMNYILFLTKHHDGFCLWDTRTSEKKVTNSPLGIDVLKKLRKSCDKYGIKLALYFSEGDWNWPGAVDGKGYDAGMGINPEMKKAQLKELCTQYGPIEFFWMDHAVGDGGLNHEMTVQWIHEFQPNCFVGFNHGIPAGRLALRELGMPGPIGEISSTVYNKDAEGSYDKYLVAEFTYPILPPHTGGAMWFYSVPEHDSLVLPAEKIFRDYQGAVKYGNIFSLDVGPDYQGRIREIDAKNLNQVGRYIRGEVKLESGPYQISFNDNGAITRLTYSGKDIEFRSDRVFEGPSLYLSNHRILLKYSGQNTNGPAFTGENQNLKAAIHYSLINDAFVIQVSVKNKTGQILPADTLMLRLGINTEMDAFPHWNKVYFPTLLRCEKDFFWGYLMNPEGEILTITSPDPIASWNNSYKSASYGSDIAEGGHRIYTVNLDLMHCLPLPARHPQQMNVMQANEEKSWTIFLKPVSQIQDVKNKVTSLSNAVMISASQYTIAENEKFDIRISGGLKELFIITPHQNKIRLEPLAWFQYQPAEGPGKYRLIAESSEGKTTEAVFSVRKPWSWYLQQAMLNAIEQEQKGGSHTESWYGLFSMFLAQKYFPDHELIKTSLNKFNELYPLMYDESDIPVKFADRIQNSACMASLLVDMYAVLQDTAYLVKASNICDFLLTNQDAKGAYRNKGIHYTSVVYIAKSFLEVCEQEKMLVASSRAWEQRYQRHFNSARKAILELASSLDNIETEGEPTFEDGMIACSYAQISMLATMTEDKQEREKLTEAAECLRNKHRCLSQLLVPDSRMNGGSLRFWESQYDILSYSNLMSSPHGWSAWRIYGLYYLYQLTGNPDLIAQIYNGLGTDVQLIDENTGKLRWGFCVDPYLKGNPELNNPNRTFSHNDMKGGNLLIRDQDTQIRENRGIRKDTVIGEQYLDMISGWYKASPCTWVTGYWEPDGGSCDNDVHEIFKCLEETVLTNAFVAEQQDGSYKGYNCAVNLTGNRLDITPYENVVEKVHFNTKHNAEALIHFAGKEVTAQISGGELKWVKR